MPGPSLFRGSSGLFESLFAVLMKTPPYSQIRSNHSIRGLSKVLPPVQPVEEPLFQVAEQVQRVTFVLLCKTICHALFSLNRRKKVVTNGHESNAAALRK